MFNSKRQFFIFCLFGLFLTVPALALAIGQTTDPIIIDNARRGSEFQERMIVVNNDNEKIEVGLSADGQIAAWVKFYLPRDLKNPITGFPMAPDQRAEVLAVFSIPGDTANGEYRGFVGAGKKAGAAQENKNESSVSVEQRIDREVTIRVTDQEIINLLVSIIPESYNVKSGDNLSVRFIYDNQSNVALKPQIQFRIKDSDNQVVYNAIFPYPDGEDAVRPLAQHEIPAIKIPTTGLANGKYVAEMEFFHNGQSILTKNFKFTIGAGSVLGVQALNLSNYWLSIPLAIVLAGILVAIIFVIRKVLQSRKGNVL